MAVGVERRDFRGHRSSANPVHDVRQENVKHESERVLRPVHGDVHRGE